MRLTVVSSARWVAEDFASTGHPVVHSHGFDLPDLDDSALWCTGSFMNRIMASGFTPPAASGGTLLLDGQDELLGRRTQVFMGSQAAAVADSWPGPVFIKPAEAKLQSLPARLYDSFGRFMASLEEYRHDRGWDETQAGQLTFLASEPSSWSQEFRCFVAHGTVVASSFYLDESGQTWDAYDQGAPPDSSAAATWAQSAVDALALSHGRAGRTLPAGFVLDVGARAGGFTVIEANASWSSNPYHCDITGVLASVLASQASADPVWAWTPDTVLLAQARPLPAG